MPVRSDQKKGTPSKALSLARRSHRGQKRASGDPYIDHPIAVAAMLQDLGADNETIAAAYLHDTLEDTTLSREEIKQAFGPKVLRLVEGVTKISKIEKEIGPAQRQMHSIRKMLRAMGRDVRVIFIKLADRIHNMETIHHLRKEKQRRIAEETLEIFCPLSNLLGLWPWHHRLADAAFKVLWPTEYRLIEKKKKLVKGKSRDQLDRWITKLESHLEKAGVEGVEIVLHDRHLHSIHEATHEQEKLLQHIETFYRLRVTAQSEEDCYRCLGHIHAFALPIPHKTDDFIAHPKVNGYQALHTTVATTLGGNIRVIIQTPQMQQVGTLGAALPYHYKTGHRWSQLPRWIEALRSLEHAQKDMTAFFRSLQTEIFGDQCRINIAGKKSPDFLDLPSHASVLDAAYYAGIEIGQRVRGAVINGQEVGLKTMISDGDIVDFIYKRSGSSPRTVSDLMITHTSLGQTMLIDGLSDLSRNAQKAEGEKVLSQAIDMTIDPFFSIAWQKTIRKRVRADRETFESIGSGVVSPFSFIEEYFDPQDFFLLDPNCLVLRDGMAVDKAVRYMLRTSIHNLYSEPIIGVQVRPDVIDVYSKKMLKGQESKLENKEIIPLEAYDGDLKMYPLHFALRWEFDQNCNPLTIIGNLQNMLDTPVSLQEFSGSAATLLFNTDTIHTLRTAYEHLYSHPSVLEIFRTSP